MTVRELCRLLLTKYPHNAEVWYIEATYGEPNTKVMDYHFEMKRGKFILGHDGHGSWDAD